MPNPSVRLHARPGKVAAGGGKTGVTPLNLRAERDTFLYVPASAPDPAPLVVYLHGATGNEQQGIRRLSGLADEFGFLLLSPASQDGTWDAIRSGFGADVRLIDQALSKVFGMRQIDARKIAVCGFSDGASYALGLGMSNGDLFRAVMAFSPGFVPRGVSGQRHAADLHFAWYERSDIADRRMQPAAGAAIEAGRVRGEVPGVRRPAHRASRDCTGGDRMVSEIGSGRRYEFAAFA